MPLAQVPIELDEIEHDILTELSEGRCTPGYLAKQLDKSQPYISENLKQLRRFQLVEKLHRGLYEITDLGEDHL